MRRRVLTGLALATGIVAGAAQAQVAQPAEDTPKEAVKALWQEQHKALDAHDIAGVMDTFADSDDIMLMGTGPGEHWVGREDVEDAYAQFMKNFAPHTKEVKCGEGAGTAEDNVAWLTAVCDFKDKKGNESRHFILNISAVLVKQDDAWRFHTMHYSQLLGGDSEPSQGASE
ncbi:SgcJ/EcaC family oxidoreductase [Thiorhodococcus minor]|uniref:SgcJ/EcaC family oxidoreductase n=1 Tax=Thiorhodococcus minor TaxID=57489 RepID=A0A6M0K5W5_9GAMM|nr:SgcJ/EcaC family oxidoreductase [Thiorhodococcus minor]NEV64333.1 SgcJ/EcaC family oxidoreductase [Thiorhodococcus minor]